MAIKNVASSAVLGLLFMSLLVIYLLLPTNGLVMFLAVLIMLVSLIVAQSRRWRDIGVMAAFAALVSMVAAALLGRHYFGGFGSVALPVVWALVLLGFFSWTQRNMVTVPKDRALLFHNRYTGSLHVAEGPIAPPLTPGVEVMRAIMPLYELSSDVRVEKINTKRLNVDFINFDVHYRVVDSKVALDGIPNRSQTQLNTAKAMDLDIAKARQDVAFWEKIFDNQMKIDLDHVVREVLFNNAFAQNPQDVYSQRGDLNDMVQTELSKLVGRWGVEITELEIAHIEVDPAVRQRLNKGTMREEETLQKRIEAQREATRIELTGEAQAKIEAARVTALVRALQESGVDLSPEMLREIVVEAIHATTEANLENLTMRA